MKTLYIYWSAIFAVSVVLLGALYDPSMRDQLFPFSFDAGRWVDALISPYLWVCVVPAVAGIVYARRAWAQNPEAYDATERMTAIWFLMNAAWFHIGCDVFSGLFQVQPNITDCYIASNAVHENPMHHPSRVTFDTVYWFELFVEMPLAYLSYWLYVKRSPIRHAVCAFESGLHLTGTVAFYLPPLLLGETSHPLISNLDRTIGTLWIIVPTLLLVRAVRQIRALAERAGEAEAPAPA